jgi:hypothetical protein
VNGNTFEDEIDTGEKGDANEADKGEEIVSS